jgi:hypothetical protein
MVVIASATTMALLRTPTAGALDGGSGSASVTGGGSSIISTILGGGRSPGRRPGGSLPACRWHTLTDLELAFVIQVATSMPELQDAALFQALQPLLQGGLAPGIDLQVLFCDGEPRTDQVRVRPLDPGSAGAIETARRTFVTRLPPPALEMSPPLGRAALVNQPVFTWVEPTQWQTPVTGTHTLDGITVDLEAVAVSLELAGGEADEAAERVFCDGPGVAWQPSSELSVQQQASSREACVIRYTKLTGVDGRRNSWLGYARLEWSGRYRINGGPWQPLGPLSSMRVFSRSVREAPTRIEQG